MNLTPLEEGQPSFRVDYITRLVDWVERWTNRDADDRGTDSDKATDSAAGHPDGEGDDA